MCWRARGRFCRYQRPALYRTTIPINGISVNQMTLLLARAPITRAASRGPKDWPALPPTWKSDWAKPYRPPEASRARREASGWKIEEPNPTQAEAPRIIGELFAEATKN